MMYILLNLLSLEYSLYYVINNKGDVYRAAFGYLRDTRVLQRR